MRPRSNSESSVRDIAESEKLAERRKQDRKLREAQSRSSEKQVDSKAEKPKSGLGLLGNRKKKGSPLDVIDKLDVTGIYGGGCKHHLILL